MAASIATATAFDPLHRLENLRPRPAKALIRVETARIQVGAALRRAIAIVGLSDKEAADLLGVDKSQLSRWLSGGENVNVARIYATTLHGPFAVEIARDADSCCIETTVTYRAVSR